MSRKNYKDELLKSMENIQPVKNDASKFASVVCDDQTDQMDQSNQANPPSRKRLKRKHEEEQKDQEPNHTETVQPDDSDTMMSDHTSDTNDTNDVSDDGKAADSDSVSLTPPQESGSNKSGKQSQPLSKSTKSASKSKPSGQQEPKEPKEHKEHKETKQAKEPKEPKESKKKSETKGGKESKAKKSDVQESAVTAAPKQAKKVKQPSPVKSSKAVTPKGQDKDHENDREDRENQEDQNDQNENLEDSNEVQIKQEPKLDTNMGVTGVGSDRSQPIVLMEDASSTSSFLSEPLEQDLDFEILLENIPVFRQMLECVNPIIPECTFLLQMSSNNDWGGIVINEIHSSNCIMMSVKFECLVKCRGQQFFSLNGTKFLKFLSQFSNRYVIISRQTGDAKIILTAFNPKNPNDYDRVHLQTVPGEVQDDNLDKILYTITTQINLEAFRSSLSQATLLEAKQTTISIYEPKHKTNDNTQTLYLRIHSVSSAYGETEKVHGIIGKTQESENECAIILQNPDVKKRNKHKPEEIHFEDMTCVMQGKYKTELLAKFVSCLKCAELTLHLANESPIILKYPLSQRSAVCFVLAPDADED